MQRKNGRRKKIAYVLCGILAVVLFSGCQSTAADGTDEKVFVYGDTTFNAENDESDVNPHNGYSGWACIRYGIGETLFHYSDSMEIEPWLAESYELVDDTTWRITLHEGISFTSGRTLDAEAVKENMMKIAANKWECDPESLVFTGNTIDNPATNESFTHMDIATFSQCGNTVPIQVTCTHSSKISPPPYMVGMAEIALDKETGSVEILDYVAVVDCGTVVNTNLATVQTEGGLVQGIGMALSESITYSPKGGLTENNFMTYKIPTRLDMGHLRVYFESSYEKTGPFGAKSIGECVINTPAPALCAAIHSACGAWVRDLPMTPEKIVMAIDE